MAVTSRTDASGATARSLRRSGEPAAPSDLAALELERVSADDPRFVQLVGELSLASARFRQLWARHDVQALEGRPIALAHPQVGDLTLHREKLAIGGTDGQLLVIYHAEPGSSSADKLALLASLARPAVVLPREESEDPIR